MQETFDPGVWRILDANCNRLREALRVTEEHLRFVCNAPQGSEQARQLRHKVQGIVAALGSQQLCRARDTGTDCLARTVHPDERARPSSGAVCAANLKRGQEAARVLEEYAKLAGSTRAVELAKEIRFGLYDLEKSCTELSGDG